MNLEFRIIHHNGQRFPLNAEDPFILHNARRRR